MYVYELHIRTYAHTYFRIMNEKHCNANSIVNTTIHEGQTLWIWICMYERCAPVAQYYAGVCI